MRVVKSGSLCFRTHQYGVENLDVGMFLSWNELWPCAERAFERFWEA